MCKDYKYRKEEKRGKKKDLAGFVGGWEGGKAGITQASDEGMYPMFACCFRSI
jgi:hypothetical protein